MAIDTTNKKLSLLEWGLDYEPGLPLSPGTLGEDDQWQLLWGWVGLADPAPVFTSSGTAVRDSRGGRIGRGLLRLTGRG